MKAMKKLIGLVILLLVALSAGGAMADGEDLYIDAHIQKLFTSEDGLLSTSTQAIAQTKEGFIWIGGYGGLVRYDGRRFQTFAYKRITRVSDLAAGEDGSLWIATSDKGLFRYDDNEFLPVSCADGDAVLNVTCLAFAPDGTLYLGTGDGLCAVNDGAIVRLEIDGLRGETIDALLCPAPDRLLCLTKAGRLFASDGKAAGAIDVGGDYALRSICQDEASGGFLAGTSGNEVLLLDDDLNVTDVLVMEGLSCINDLRRDEGGAICLCADNGIAIYVDGSIRMQNLWMNNSVDEMMIDDGGNDWFVSSRQGVLEVSRSLFSDVSQSAGLKSMVVNAIQRIGDTLYIGHDAGLVALNADDFKRIDTSPLPELNATRVRALLADDEGSLWIGTMKKGLYCRRADGETVRYTMLSHPALKSDNIRSITQTDAGVLVGTDVGAYLVNGDEVANVLNDPDQLAFRILSAVKFGDTICLGSDGNGLYFVRDGEVVNHVTVEDGLSSSVIMKAYWSAKYNGVWLVTGNDIDFLGEDGAITSISNFPTTNNLDLLIMQNGDAWVFTGTGIYQTTEDSLLHDDEPKYLQFRRVDGLPYEVTPNSYQCMTDDMLYVCGSGGVFSLETDFAQSETGDYNLVIDSVEADGQLIHLRPNEACEIDASVKRIDINAYVLTYQAGNPFVFYYLEGFDDGETVAQQSGLGHISYTNLNGGSYLFHFGIRDYKTGEVRQEITLPIVKKNPWYQLPSVRLAGVAAAMLLLALITLLITRARARRIERELQSEYAQKEKEHLQNIAYRDYLTGLYTRNYLDVWNTQLLPGAKYPITFVSIDLNNLKIINDSYGHKNGDQLLAAMAGLLKKYFADEAYSVIRIGGDEFLVLARGVDGDEIDRTMEKLAEEAKGVTVNGIPVTFAYGACTQQEGEFNFDDGLRLSDMELLARKDELHGRTNE